MNPTEEVKPEKKKKSPKTQAVVETPTVVESESLPHYEERLKVHGISNKSLLPNRFAYNPSILEVGHTTLMAYRYAIPGHTLYNTAIAICELDKNWNVKPSSNRKLDLIRRQTKATTFDDPRLFMHNGKIYLLYINGMLMPSGVWSSSIFIGDLDQIQNNRQYVSALPNIGKNENAAAIQGGRIACEKNWTPFELNGKLYFVYTINPLIVCEYDVAINRARQISETKFDQSFWKHGSFIAGGTPLIRRGNEMVGFFHTFTNDDPANPTLRNYHVGFWAMSITPPFKVTRMSRIPFMTAKKDEKRELRHPNSPWLPNCIFPGGFIERDGKVFIAQGWQDCTCEIVECTWEQIEEHVVEVK